VLRVTRSFGRPFLADIGAIGLVLGEGLRLTASDPRVPATGAAVDPIIVLRDS
jgi:hypothetical protein